MAEQARKTNYDVTVAILTRNGGAVLERALRAVGEQQTNRRIELLAVDSGSTDGTLETLKRFGVRVINIPTDDFNWGATRDLAYQHASAPIIVNLSQDAVPNSHSWLERLIAPLEDPGVGASCGTSIPDPDRAHDQFPWEKNGYFYFTREIRKFTAKYGKGLSFANSAVPRAVWERLRLDPQPTGEDFQFQIKLHSANLAIAFPDDAAVLHHHDYALYSLFMRCRHEGFALRLLGCPYNEWDLLCDLAGHRKYIQWLRELKRGSMRSLADVLFPVLRPIAVYAGSRFARRVIWY